MRDLITYAFINARIRAMYGKFLTEEKWEELLQAKDLPGALAALRGTLYDTFIREDVVRDKGLEFIERALVFNDTGIHQKILKNMRHNSRARKVIELLRERDEINEIKVMLRCWHDKKITDGREHVLPEAFVPPLDVGRVMSSRNMDELVNAFDGSPYQSAFFSSSKKYRETGSLFYIESALDREHFERLWREVDRLPGSDRTVAARLLGIETDIENISCLIRLRQYFDFSSADLSLVMLPRGYRVDERMMRQLFIKEGLGDMVRGMAVRPYQDLASLFGPEMERSALFLLEAALYQVLFKKARRVMGGFPFTIGTILAYLILKRAETRKMISILYGKEYGMPPDRIKKALVC